MSTQATVLVDDAHTSTLARTTWVVHRTLRKIYVLLPDHETKEDPS